MLILLLTAHDARAAFTAGGDDDVKVEVVEPGMPTLFINEVRDILLHYVGHGAAVAVFRQRRSLQNQVRHVGHLEDIVRGDEHRVRVDLRLDQADQVFNDCANVFQFRFLRLKRTFPLVPWARVRAWPKTAIQPWPRGNRGRADGSPAWGRTGPESPDPIG